MRRSTNAVACEEMISRTRSTRTRQVSTALVMAGMLAVLVIAPIPARGATAVEITARALLGGRYTAGGWLAISASLVNDGAPTEGYVVAEANEGTIRRFVELPAGSRKTVTLYVRPQAFARNITVAFTSPEGDASSTVEVRALERSSSQVAIIGDAAGSVRAQIVAVDQGDLPEPVTFGPVDLPERPEPLDGVAGIVWAADSSQLTEAQRRSLERWVAAGGQLIVLGGPDWQARTAAFADLLPVQSLGSVDGVDVHGLAAFAGTGSAPGTSATVALGEVRDDAAILVTGAAGEPLLITRTVGAGRVIFSSVDLATEAYRTWEGAPAVWSRLLPTNQLLDEFFGGIFPAEEAANLMTQALSNLPSLEVPPAELLLGVIVGYILLIGPLSYLVLRRFDRRELAWVTAPILVLLFTACSYGIGASMKGGDVIINQITMLRAGAEGSVATAQSYAGLFSPSRATYDLSVEADALMAPLNAAAFAPVQQPATSYLAEQGDPSHLRGLEVGVFGFQGIRADAVVNHAPTLGVEWAFVDDELVGTVTNTGDEVMEDVAVISSSAGRMIGDLEPGASEEFTVSLSNFNGSLASDLVYGFVGGFEQQDAEQRQEMMRRSVIDSLVGYGGVPGRGMGFGIGVSQGPFVIGWVAGTGPVPVQVDDQEIQRHEQTVEVISGRPRLGPGDVELDPAQLPVRVASVEGDASQNQPGWVSLGSGEVVFAITLPLEAAELDPTEVEIVTGTDPSMVFMDQGAFGGFLPAGYSASVRNQLTGEWIALGNLNAQNSWEVPDPDAVLSETGRIEVRISGAENVDEAFGQQTVFAGARVSGVLP